MQGHRSSNAARNSEDVRRHDLLEEAGEGGESMSEDIVNIVYTHHIVMKLF